MRIEVPKQIAITLENHYDDCSILNIPDNVARLIYDEMSKRYFQEDFTNFLDWKHEDFEICNADYYCTWKYLWATYQEKEDMNVAVQDTFEAVLESVWELCGRFTCCICGKKLLNEFPPADCNGNCYCDECAHTQTDFCEDCGDRRLKSELIYDKDGVGYCEYCKHADE